MLNQQIINPKSIAVIGASDDIQKPGGKILHNLIQYNFAGKLYAQNPKADEIQAIKCYRNLTDLPKTELAILAVAAKFCTEAVRILCEEKGTKAFIIISAGFSETSEEGARIEHEIRDLVDMHNAVLIGPNGIGVLTPNYAGVFTSPVPKLHPQGVDFISGSGATAVFIMDLGIPNGLRFANVFSVGNSAQIGVEEILEHMDETFDYQTSPRVKMLYLEQIRNPEKLLKHARSLVQKGCRIAAVKSGSSDAGSRAASSHTGALASSDVAVDALFRKAGIVRCASRQELVTVSAAFTYPEISGKRIGIITHAGGPAVMLTDALEKGGLEVPKISNPTANELLAKLYAGSSVANPIDFLATGTGEQLSEIIDFCNNSFDELDAMIVIFGTPGLTKIFDVYDILEQRIRTSRKPIFPVLPSITEASEEIKAFTDKGLCFFPEEVLLANALSKIYFTPKPEISQTIDFKLDTNFIQLRNFPKNSGWQTPENVQKFLDAAEIPRAHEVVVSNEDEAVIAIEKVSYPLVMKVIGPLHKSDVGGVVLNVNSEAQVRSEFRRMMQIAEAKGVLIQPMLSGLELFVGVKREKPFGHLIFVGLGGIYIEVLKDVASELAPISRTEAERMLKSLKSFALLKGVRGQKGVNIDMFIDIILRVSALVRAVPEIEEMDINPLSGMPERIMAVDARIFLSQDF